MIIFLLIMAIIGWGFFFYVSYKRYSYDGKVVVTNTDDGRKVFSLELDTDPYEIEEKSYISLKVEALLTPE